ncbi:MAG: DHH family phosphoesterase [Clostridia bacterium]|nr:DHH family phosphoesterase [Clostridia bacterium]
MKRKAVWSVSPVVLLFGILSFLLLLTLLFVNRTVFWIAAAVCVAVWAYGFWRIRQLKHDLQRYVQGVCGQLNHQNRKALEETPLPVALVSEQDEIVWYNELFRRDVLGGTDRLGDEIRTVFPSVSTAQLSSRFLPQVACGSSVYALYTAKLKTSDEAGGYVLYCVDNTELAHIAEEYALSRPVVLSLYLDNGDEVMKDHRDGERAQMFSKVEMLLEDWANKHDGIFRKNAVGRFLILLEQRQLDAIENERFNILDKVRALPTVDNVPLTLSIGVGKGDTLYAADMQARQTLDMALGRGGDQAVIKTPTGYDFYGGLAKSVEKRTKVRSRVIASALQQMINDSDLVLVMGHRYSDLDCLGSGAALTAACRSMGKEAYTVYDPATTLATALVDYYRDYGKEDMFIDLDTAQSMVTPDTLLIITDIHQPERLDAPELYHIVERVAVIDHHRKMVDHIDDAMLFYHEPHSSSASEMVSEVLQYMEGIRLSRLEAEALLAGIMLDTRYFVMKAGVRTFEAAAFLRKLGADTIKVKRMFSEDMSIYRHKADIVSSAKSYCGTAIACATESGNGMRIAAAQAADELLCVREVEASFVMFAENGGVNISARSYGEINVQLIMEALGGGGHQTMAGAYVRDADVQTVNKLLQKAIDQYLTERARAQASQQ